MNCVSDTCKWPNGCKSVMPFSFHNVYSNIHSEADQTSKMKPFVKIVKELFSQKVLS